MADPSLTNRAGRDIGKERQGLPLTAGHQPRQMPGEIVSSSRMGLWRDFSGACFGGMMIRALVADGGRPIAA